MNRTILATVVALALGIAWQALAQTTWPDLSTPPPSEGTGARDAALIIGIEDYLLVDDVPGAVANADDWYRYLKQTRGLPLGSAVVLRNHEATRESVLREARDAGGRVASGGTLWLVFIGHGAPSKDGQDGLLLGADVQQTAESVYARGVSQDELLEALQGGQAQTLLVLDTCFSGKSAGGSALVSGLQPLVPNYAVQRPSALLLSAGRGDQFAGPLPGAARPAFSYLLLGALYGWGDLDGDGEVTATEAVTYAQGALVETVRDRRQTPQVQGDGDVVLSSGGVAGPDLTSIALSRAGGVSESATTVSAGGDVDLTARAREVQLRSQAEQEWVALADMREVGSPEAAEIVELFIEKYGEASVTVDGEVVPVELVYVDEAREWLNRYAERVLISVDLGGEVIDRHGYQMVRVQPGEFWMGSPSGEKGRGEVSDETYHRVRLTRAFAIGTTEVTQDLYEVVMGDNPSRFEGGRHPVEKVSWYEAVAFCNRLSELEGLEPVYRISGKNVTWDHAATGYRLPTESEWEYAASGGEEYSHSGSDELEAVGWFHGNARKTTHEVGGMCANSWGLFDMSGNVWEWVWDLHGWYPTGTSTDPVGTTGRNRVARGGSYDCERSNTRVAERYPRGPGHRADSLGFRVARSL